MKTNSKLGTLRTSRKESNIHEYYPSHPDVNLENIRINMVGKYSISKPRDADAISRKILQFWKDIMHGSSHCTIVDGTAGFAGNAISFAKYFQKVIAIEKDPIHFSILKNNIFVYRLEKKVHTVNGDYVSMLLTGKRYSVGQIVFLDPPWTNPGEKWYSKRGIYMLKLSGKPIYEIIDYLLRETSASLVVIKVPSNFDFGLLMKRLPDFLLMSTKIANFYCIFCCFPSFG